MKHLLPPMDSIRQALEQKSRSELFAIADLSKVSYHTLVKIRGGQITSPGYPAIRSILPHLGVKVTVKKVLSHG